MGSTRLPGKVLREIEGRPLLWYEIARLQQLNHPCTLLIATSTEPENKPLVDFAEDLGIECFQGNENDVLDRYYQACLKFKADIIVRVTGDCPLIDPGVIDRGIDIFLEGNHSYVSNVHPPTYPDGLDVEIFSFSALERAWREAGKESEREHVTPYIWNHPELFTRMNFENSEDWSSYRLTVDEPEDFVLVSKIITEFQTRWSVFSTKELIDYLELNQELLGLNKDFERNEGYLKSLEKDSNN